MLYSLYYFFPILLISVLCAGSTISVKGIIIDQETNQPLPYANIEIRNTNQGTVSNIEGMFEINLDPKNTTLEISYIGYHNKIININKSTDNLIIKLTPTPVLGEAITVYAYNWVERFILKAIDKKHEMLNSLQYYTASAYSKTNYKFATTDTVFGMLEAISRISFQNPDLYHEEVLSAKVPPNMKNVPYEALAINQQLNLYQEEVKVYNFSIVSPLNDDALDYYDYKTNKQYLAGVDTVISIKISPKTEGRPLFTGELIFNKQTHILLEANLEGNSIVKSGMADSLAVLQKYSLKDSLFCLPVFTKFQFRMNFAGIPYRFIQEYSFVNYTINDPENNPYISADNSLHFEPKLAYDFDSKREEIFKIPLSESEKQYQEVMERMFINAPFYRKVYLFFFTDLLPAMFDQPATIAGIKMEKFSNWYHFNKVEGNFVGAEYQPVNQTNLNIYGNLGYSFGLNKILYNTRARYKGLLLELKDGIVNLGNFNYNRAGQSIIALFSHEDNIHYYSSEKYALSFTQNISSRLSIRATVQYEKQKPVSNSTEFSFFKKDKIYKPNFQINEYGNHRAGISMSYIENKDMLDGKTILYRGSSFLNTSLAYFQSDKSKLNSTEDRAIIDFSLHRYQSIYNPVALDFKLAYHVQGRNDYIQQMNFLNTEQTFYVNSNDLSFYTINDYDFYVKDYLRVSSDLTMFNLPQIYTLKISVGALVSFLRPLKQKEFTEFTPLRENFWEYGIALKEVSVFHFYLLTNNFNDKQVKLRMKFGF